VNVPYILIAFVIMMYVSYGILAFAVAMLPFIAIFLGNKRKSA